MRILTSRKGLLFKGVALILAASLLATSAGGDLRPAPAAPSTLAAPSPFAPAPVRSPLFSRAAALIPSAAFSQGALLVTTIFIAGLHTSLYEKYKLWLLGGLGLIEAGIWISSRWEKQNPPPVAAEEDFRPGRFEKGMTVLVWGLLGFLFFPIVMDHLGLGWFERYFYWGGAWLMTMVALRRLYLFSSQIFDFAGWGVASLVAKFRGAEEKPTFHSERRAVFSKRASFIIALFFTSMLGVFSTDPLPRTGGSPQNRFLLLFGRHDRVAWWQLRWRVYAGIGKDRDGNVFFHEEHPYKKIEQRWSLSAKLRHPSQRQQIEELRRGLESDSIYEALTYLEEIRDPASTGRLIELAEQDISSFSTESYISALANQYQMATPQEQKKILGIVVKCHQKYPNLPVDKVIILAAQKMGIEGIAALMLELKDDEEAVLDLIEWIQNEWERDLSNQDFARARQLVLGLRGKLGNYQRKKIDYELGHAASLIEDKETVWHNSPTFFRDFRENSWLWLVALFQSLAVIRLAADAKRRFSRRGTPRNKNVKTPEEMAELVKAGIAKYGREPMGRNLSDAQADQQADSHDISLRLADGNEPLFMLDESRRKQERAARAAHADPAGWLSVYRTFLKVGQMNESLAALREAAAALGEKELLKQKITPKDLYDLFPNLIGNPDVTFTTIEFWLAEIIRLLKELDKEGKWPTEGPLTKNQIVSNLEQRISEMEDHLPPYPPGRPEEPPERKRSELITFVHMHFLGVKGLAQLPLSDQAVFRGDRSYIMHFEKADLRGVNFTRANLVRARFDGADLREAVFTRAQLAGAHFNKADLRKANLKEANCVEGAFWIVDELWEDLEQFYEGADFSDADMRGASLVEAELSGHYRGRETSGSNAGGEIIDPGVIFARTDLRGANLSETCLDYLDLRTAKLEGSRFGRIIWGSAVPWGPPAEPVIRIRRSQKVFFPNLPDELFQIEEDLPVAAEQAVAVAL